MTGKLEPLAYNTSEASRVLSISRPTLYKLMQDPSFPKFRVGTRVLIPADDLRRWVHNQTRREETA